MRRLHSLRRTLLLFHISHLRIIYIIYIIVSPFVNLITFCSNIWVNLPETGRVLGTQLLFLDGPLLKSTRTSANNQMNHLFQKEQQEENEQWS